jgi:hypothetical protein
VSERGRGGEGVRGSKNWCGVETLKCKWERRYQNEWARKKWAHHLNSTAETNKHTTQTKNYENFCSTAKTKEKQGDNPMKLILSFKKAIVDFKNIGIFYMIGSLWVEKESSLWKN